jgi:PhnB protein
VPEQNWQALETVLASAPGSRFRERLRNELESTMQMTMTPAGVPEGFTTVTPYVTVAEVERLIAFAKVVFDAEEVHRATGSAGGVHCTMAIGDSMLMFGGGPMARGQETLGALHVYVPDVDVVYRRALAAGAESVYEPEDKPYGERNCGVKDLVGNLWFVATRLPGPRPVEGLRTVTPFVLAKNALELIDFLKEALSAREIAVSKSPEGDLQHAAIWIGNAVLEFGESLPQPAAFYLYVPDADAAYQQAVAAGATSLTPPADQRYGDRMGGVRDPWGNTWYIASNVAR